MTKTEQICAAITAALTAAGLPVRADTDSPHSYEDPPVIVVVAGNEMPAPSSGVGYVYWDLQVALVIGATAADTDPNPKLGPEPIRAAAHAALYQDRTLGGAALDIVAGSVSRAIDEENPAMGITEAVYQIKYRQMEGTI
jgi:hypothetical protein